MPDTSTAADAFALLGDPTRLEIVRALGESGPFDPLPFSTLKQRVGVADSGRFSYHLDRLVDGVVEQTDDGYKLRMPGVLVYQLMEAGVAATGHDPIGPLDTGIGCRHDCGGTYEASYIDFRFSLACPSCGHDPVSYPVDPGSFRRDGLPESLLDAADDRLKRDAFTMRLGRCPYCAGPVEGSLGSETADSAAEVCAAGLPAEGRAPTHRWTCTRCQWVFDARSGGVALVDPRIAGAFADAGIDTLSVAPWSERYEWSERLVSDDPVRIELSMRIDDVALTAVFGERFEVVELRDRVTPASSEK